MLRKKILWVFVGLSLLYLILSIVTPTDQSVLLKYSLTEAEVQLLKLTITLPLIGVWMVGYYGWNKVNRYAETIKEDKDGESMMLLSKGLLALVLWLPIVTVFNSIGTNIAFDNENLKAPFAIGYNYLNILILLIATYYLFKASAIMVKSLKKPLPWTWRNAGLLILLSASLLFIYLTLTNDYRQFPANNGNAAYYLPDWLLVPTIIIPYLLVFYFSFRTIQYLHVYKNQIPGVIYREALKYIANGIAVTVIGVLGIRYLTSMTTVFDEAALRTILAIIYALVLLIAVGFILIANGAKKLQKIEEI